VCKTTSSDATSATRGQRNRTTAQAIRAPTIWATMNGRTETGAMPAKVLDRVRAIVTAGLAKLVEEVKK
jgi:hypothetical protein